MISEWPSDITGISTSPEAYHRSIYADALLALNPARPDHGTGDVFWT